LPLVYVAAGPNQAVLLNLETGEPRHAFACSPAELMSDKPKLAEWKSAQESLFSKKWEVVDLSARHLDRYIQEAKFPSSSVHASAFSTPHHSFRAMYCPSDVTESATGIEPLSVLTAGTDMMVRYWDCQGGSTSGLVTAPPDEPKSKWESKEINARQATLFFSLSVPKTVPNVPSKSKGKFVVRPAHQDAILDMTGMRMPSDVSPHLITAGRDSIVRIWK